jgi:hypothetical protein
MKLTTRFTNDRPCQGHIKRANGSSYAVETVRDLPSWVSCGSRQTEWTEAVEHGSRGIYIAGSRNLATASKDGLRRISVWYSEL